MISEIIRGSNEAVADSHFEFQEDVDALNDVVSEFIRSIQEKDKEAFHNLFYSDQTPWIGKFDDESEQIATTNNPTVINKQGIFDISKSAFINSLVAPPESIKCAEEFYNLSIDTDGLMGTISFDYSSMVNNRPIKNGRESWQMIKTNDGWRIVSVVYSIKFD